MESGPIVTTRGRARTRGGIVAGVLLLAAVPLGAQEPPPPHDRPGIERLERLRLERLHDALDLTEEQAATLTAQMERSHTAMRESFRRQTEAMEAVEKSLAANPVDQEALRRALADVEAAREEMERERERHMAELGRTLTPEQRAKFLVFNRQFEVRLRELVEKHRGRGHGEEDGGHGAERPAPSREARIEALEKRIGELQEELEELKSGADD
ncbi:MAG TPA: periplasmic heavy metal sensor [Gemmatimonadota bacterium]|jgi:Spy/CpxP family protein refolding chaperone